MGLCNNLGEIFFRMVIKRHVNRVAETKKDEKKTSRLCAQDRTRTYTVSLPLVPETSVSTISPPGQCCKPRHKSSINFLNTNLLRLKFYSKSSLVLLLEDYLFGLQSLNTRC